MLSNKINFFCPNCSSDKYIGKTTIGKNYKDEPYKNVTSEIQCAKCFMDIPSIISENISPDKQNEMSKLWNEIYKPSHKENAAQCSKCFRYYWEIEKNLSENYYQHADHFTRICEKQNEINSEKNVEKYTESNLPEKITLMVFFDFKFKHLS